jgi:hypothetical protein
MPTESPYPIFYPTDAPYTPTAAPIAPTAQQGSFYDNFTDTEKGLFWGGIAIIVILILVLIYRAYSKKGKKLKFF